MNENCKYCKTAKTCLENAEYNSIYCHLHKRIPKVIDKTYDELEQENQQLKDIINKANKKIDNMFDVGDENKIIDDLLELQKLLDNKGE